MADEQPRYVLHESIALVGIRVLSIQIFIAVIIVVTLITTFSLSNMPNESNIELLILMIILLVLQLINGIMTITLILSWAHTLYIISPKEITVRRGIWHVRQTTYAVKSIDTVSVHRPFLGRILNFGTIAFYTADTDEAIKIENIPDPEIYAELLE